MDLKAQKEKAEVFRRMHDRTRILILGNAWDVASARVFEEAGFRAIGTTSAGVAYALGYPDGELIPRDEMIAAVGRIAQNVSIPVSADIEAAYAGELKGVVETIKAVIDTGAIGVNLEDAIHPTHGKLYEIPAAVERVRAAREAAVSAGVPIVINARTDVFLLGVGEANTRFDDAVRRANAYREAGADCLFVPGVRDAATIGALAKALNGPMNILAGPGTPPVPELQRLGVARVSVGSGPMRAAMSVTRKIAMELLGPGTYTGFGGDTISHPDANRLLARRNA
jgi:2-methylisocitrate lyase-like PEP mutase family enzyme